MLYFDALAPVTGFELWRSDGTESGTVLVHDANPGIPYGRSFIVGPRTLADGGRVALFSATDGVTGLEFWKTDDRRDTVALGEIAPGPGSSAPQVFTLVGNLVMFTANDNIRGRELWVVPSFVPGLPEAAVDHLPGHVHAMRLRHGVPVSVYEHLETIPNTPPDPDYPEPEE